MVHYIPIRIFAPRLMSHEYFGIRARHHTMCQRGRWVTKGVNCEISYRFEREFMWVSQILESKLSSSCLILTQNQPLLDSTMGTSSGPNIFINSFPLISMKLIGLVLSKRCMYYVGAEFWITPILLKTNMIMISSITLDHEIQSSSIRDPMFQNYHSRS